ncbi:MAG: VTT domain-containing protein [Pseudomonadota bacterium]
MSRPPSTISGNLTVRKIVFWTLLLLAFAGGGWALTGFDFDPYFRALPFDGGPDAPWYRGAVGFALFCTLAISLSCPRQVVSFFAGYFFGYLAGFLAALVAATLSCILVFFLSRIFRERVRPFVQGRLRIAVDFWAENTFWATLLWRFIPAGSNLLTNVAAGVLNLPAWRFVAGSCVGYIPHTLVFALIGSGVQVQSNTQLIVSACLLIVSAAIGFFLWRRYKARAVAPSP